LAGIDRAMDRITENLGLIPGVDAARTRGARGNETRVLARTANIMVKVETSPVMRGVVFDSSSKRVHPMSCSIQTGWTLPTRMKAVKWKLINLHKLIKSDPQKHAQQTSALVALLKQ